MIRTSDQDRFSILAAKTCFSFFTTHPLHLKSRISIMDPQTSTSDSSSLPDILPRLPKELFVLALDTLPLVDILNATAINKDYRDRIYSSPQLFSTIDEAIYPEEVEGVSHPERVNRATFKLIKCASLSNNRLKNVSLNLIPFEVDFFRADLSHWLSTSTYLLLH